MSKKLILRLSNELGNQMFMYASAYSIAKELNRKLYIDDETAFLSKKNISKFGLNFFTLTSSIAPEEFKFKNISGYFKRKIIRNTDFLRINKKFFVEKKDKNKISKYSSHYKILRFSDNLFLEGHFESERYFKNYNEAIKNEFKFKNLDLLKDNKFYRDVSKDNSVSICLRQNRYSEGKGRDTQDNRKKSWDYTLEQINYINKSVEVIKSKIPNPTFFLWSNDLSDINNSMFNFPYKVIEINKNHKFLDARIQSLYLLTKCNHFVVTNSTFNWWGAWLSKRLNNIVLHPSDKFFKNFYLNNDDFWPLNWDTINV